MGGKSMFTLCIRYTIDPNKLKKFKAYAEGEQEPIRASGGKNVQYLLPTDFAGPTNEAMGFIEFPTLDDYERYRNRLASNPDHKRNVSSLAASGAVRSIIERI
jgi:hypothetical protein